MNEITGLLVVRLPAHNFDREGRGAFLAVAPKIGNIFYGGIDRMPWFDLDEDYYAKTLPGDLLEIRKSLSEGSRDFTGIELCYDLQMASKVLEWSNREVTRNEVIAVRSQKLVELKKKSLALDSEEIDWLGFDFVSLGHWSLLAGGMFTSPSYFLRWQAYLNEHGLMSNENILREFASDYSAAAKKNGVEPIPEEVYGLEAIEIGRIVANRSDR
jgi:hypothetical protein